MKTIILLLLITLSQFSFAKQNNSCLPDDTAQKVQVIRITYYNNVVENKNIAQSSNYLEFLDVEPEETLEFIKKAQKYKAPYCISFDEYFQTYVLKLDIYSNMDFSTSKRHFSYDYFLSYNGLEVDHSTIITKNGERYEFPTYYDNGIACADEDVFLKSIELKQPFHIRYSVFGQQLTDVCVKTVEDNTDMLTRDVNKVIETYPDALKNNHIVIKKLYEYQPFLIPPSYDEVKKEALSGYKKIDVQRAIDETEFIRKHANSWWFKIYFRTMYHIRSFLGLYNYYNINKSFTFLW